MGGRGPSLVRMRRAHSLTAILPPLSLSLARRRARPPRADVNSITQEVTWVKPAAAGDEAPPPAPGDDEAAPPGPADEDAPPVPPDDEAPPPGGDVALPPGWAAILDDNTGRFFYSCAATGEVSWVPPPA